MDDEATCGAGNDSEEYNPFDGSTDEHRAFQSGWKNAPELADKHVHVEDSSEGKAFLKGIFARLIHEDRD
jgi:hypothetical protein